MDTLSSKKNSPFIKKLNKIIAAKLNYSCRSFGLVVPSVGKTGDYTHFAWFGHPDITIALADTKKINVRSTFC